MHIIRSTSTQNDLHRGKTDLPFVVYCKPAGNIRWIVDGRAPVLVHRRQHNARRAGVCWFVKFNRSPHRHPPPSPHGPHERHLHHHHHCHGHHNRPWPSGSGHLNAFELIYGASAPSEPVIPAPPDDSAPDSNAEFKRRQQHFIEHRPCSGELCRVNSADYYGSSLHYARPRCEQPADYADGGEFCNFLSQARHQAPMPNAATERLTGFRQLTKPLWCSRPPRPQRTGGLFINQNLDIGKVPRNSYMHMYINFWNLRLNRGGRPRR